MTFDVLGRQVVSLTCSSHSPTLARLLFDCEFTSFCIGLKPFNLSVNKKHITDKLEAPQTGVTAITHRDATFGILVERDRQIDSTANMSHQAMQR
jgi:hypothetical protein